MQKKITALLMNTWEVDHDIVNDIESELSALSAYIETGNKSMALASIRVIIDMWSDIGTK